MEDESLITSLAKDQTNLINYIKYLESLKYKNEVHKQAIIDLTNLAKNISNACLSLQYRGGGIIA
jgi:hypothetical protein